MVLEPHNWIAQGPFFTLLRAAIAGWIIRGGMPLCSVSEIFNQRRAMIGTGAMLGFSGYFAYLANGVKPKAINERRFSLLCSAGFAVAGAYRWFM